MELELPGHHARVLLHRHGVRLRDIAARLGITDRSAHGIVTDLTAAGYVVKQKVAATATRSRCTSRCQNRQPGTCHRPKSWLSY